MRQFPRRRLLLAGLIPAAALFGLPVLVKAQDPGRRLAFFVAVPEYNHAALDPLPYTERDVEASSALLKQAEYDLVVLSGARGKKDAKLRPTAANIRDRLKEFLESREVTRRDLIIVGLTGHGLQPRGSSDSFFCPLDANPSMTLEDEGRVQVPQAPKTLLSIAQLLQTLEDSGIGPKLVLVDACRTEPKSKGTRRSAGGIDRLTLAELPPQTAVLLSCSRGEYSYENEAFGGGHGAFFHTVLDGLKGAGADLKNRVTWDSLQGFVREEVPARIEAVPQLKNDGAQQHPNLKSNLEGQPPVLIPASVLAKISPNAGKVDIPKNTIPKESPASVIGTVKRTQEGQVRDDNALKLKLVWCPPDSFRMGSPKNETGHREEDQVDVTLSSGFWLGKFEVTQSQYEKIMGKNPSYFCATGEGKSRVSGQQTAEFPVEQVSYDDALEFCKKFTEAERKAGRLPTGWQYTLPTEAQWEYACRTKESVTPFSFGTSLNGTEANCDGTNPYGTTNKGDYLKRTTTVGSYPANKWGLHDMHGNVWEWCLDAYEAKLPGKTDPVAKTGSLRVLRGGGWNSVAVRCRSAARYLNSPGLRNYILGFRLALSPVQSAGEQEQSSGAGSGGPDVREA